jgi:hypothetical protein
MSNLHLRSYLFYNKVSPKKLKSYYNIYCKAFKTCFWSVFGNFKKYTKKSKVLLKVSSLKINKQSKKVCSQFNKFFRVFEFQFDQILFKVGFFSKLSIIKRLLKFRCIFVNGKAANLKNLVLVPNDIFYLSPTTYNLVRTLFYLKRLLLLQYSLVTSFYRNNSKGIHKHFLPSKHLYTYLLVNYSYYIGIFINPLFLVKPLLFNRFSCLDLNNFYLSLKK